MRIILSFLLVIALSSCSNQSNFGHFVSDNNIEKIVIGKTNKQDVQNLIGSPSIKPKYVDDTWLYVSRIMKKGIIKPHTLENQRLLIVKFNKKDVVESIEIKINEAIEGVKIDSTSTKPISPRLGKTKTFIKNIGRYNKK